MATSALEMPCGPPPCVLRPFRPDDAEAIAPLLNERDVWINLSDRIPHPYETAHATAFIAKVMHGDPPRHFAISRDGRAIGGIGIILGEGIGRVSAEIGYWLGKPYWGQGIMTPAIRAMTAYAIERFDLTRVFALIFARNAASARALEKAGYVREGSMRRSVIKDGVVEDEYMYAYYA